MKTKPKKTQKPSLRYCPWCGPGFKGELSVVDIGARFQVVCMCGASGPDDNETKSMAIAAWNGTR